MSPHDGPARRNYATRLNGDGRKPGVEWQPASQSHFDVKIDDFSLIRLPQTELAHTTLVKRAALEGVISPVFAAR